MCRTFLTLLALLVGLVFLQSPGTSDVDIWTSWVRNADSLGPVRGYQTNLADYPPLASVILWGSDQLAQPLGLSTFKAIKYAILAFLLLTAGLFWLWTRDLKLTLLLYFGLLLNSVALGYVDIFVAPAFVAALWLLQRRRLVGFALCFTLACLTKWQPLLIAPFLAVYLLQLDSQRVRWAYVGRLALRVGLPAAGLLGATVAVFGLPALAHAFQASLDHPYLSGNALNLNWIITHCLHALQPEQYGPLQRGLAEYIVNAPARVTLVPRLLFAAAYLLALYAFARREKSMRNLLLYAALGFLAYYTFNTGVHENHLFLVVLLAAALVWLDRTQWPFAAVVILMNSVNLFVFYGVDGALHFNRTAFGLDVALPLSIFNVLFFVAALLSALLPAPPDPIRG